jgi:glutathione synthase/RimK-type ligase-like ATP-grasp enzyme
MNLVFGAVDIAEKADGTMVVLEINRAPGIEGNSIPAYCAAIQKWAKGESEGE